MCVIKYIPRDIFIINNNSYKIKHYLKF